MAVRSRARVPDHTTNTVLTTRPCALAFVRSSHVRCDPHAHTRTHAHTHARTYTRTIVVVAVVVVADGIIGGGGGAAAAAVVAVPDRTGRLLSVTVSSDAMPIRPKLVAVRSFVFAVAPRGGR